MAFRLEGIVGEGRNTAAAVAEYLDEHPAAAEMVINSPGGVANEGAAILAEMQAHGNVTVSIRGMAASAASLVAMGGQRIVMSESALLMIHDPSALTFGDARQHRASAAVLDTMAETYASAYARASGHSLRSIRDLMLAETWLSAEDALALHFVDEIEKPSEPVMLASFDPSRFRHPPESILRQWGAQPEQKEGAIGP